MKEIVKASLSGISFTFDLEAYEKLNAYFNKLEKGYKGDPDGKEIIADIEARVVEIILSKQNSEQIVPLHLVESIIDQMGMPDEVNVALDSQPKSEFPRRLYRNPENRKLGGVCSGLGTFFDVDPVWIRIGFCSPLILLILTSAFPIPIHGFLGTMTGVAFLLYLILWFAIPVARTPRQKLEMRGERITASSIQQNYHNESAANEASPKARQSESIIAHIFSILGRIILFIIKAIVVFVGLILALIALIIFISMVAVMLGAGTVGHTALSDLLPMSGMSMGIYFALVLLIVLLPTVLLCYMIFKGIFSSRTNKTFMSVMLGLWLIVTVFTSVITIKNFSVFKVNMDTIRVGAVDFTVKHKPNQKHVRPTKPGEGDIIYDTVRIMEVDTVQLR